MREPPVKKTLYWCDQCDIPLLGKQCGCGAIGRSVPLLQPYDLRPVLTADRECLTTLVRERFGNVPLPKIMLLNKTGGLDRNDLVIIHGERFGWLSFDPADRRYSFDISPDALPFVIPYATRGIVDLETSAFFGDKKPEGRIGGKKFQVTTDVPDGTIIIRYKNRSGTGVVKDGYIRIKELMPLKTRSYPDPDWDCVIHQNRYHLKNIERNAIRTIRQHMRDRPRVNVSFSGGKDSTAVLALARKAGVTDSFFLDTGIEFPETIAFIEEQGVPIIRRAGDFWRAVQKAGPPGKDNRWCCKLLKLNPLKLFLAETGPCVTIQGNRWYESWNRADLAVTSQNPANPLQLNISPIRNWRALEVYLYLWWREIPINPLYEKGLERIGCYLCPAVLESEAELIRNLHPDMALRWDEFLGQWAEKEGLPPEFVSWGLWRWKELPAKMQELCRSRRLDPAQREHSRSGSSSKVSSSLITEPGPASSPAPETPLPSSHEDTDIAAITRDDFSLLADIIYLDSAATSLSPEPVLSAMLEFERNYRSNVGRGIHRLSRIATQRYWHAHEKVAGFIRGEKGTTVFTKNATEAINMVARGLGFGEGDHIITTILEHHSNLLPWMQLKEEGSVLSILGIHPDYSLDIGILEDLITNRTRLVAVTHASNALGVLTPVREIAEICHDNGVLLLIDGSQSVPHIPVDIEDIDADFLCFSGHKMLGPTGTGVLWMKEPIIRPGYLGGGMIDTVSTDEYTLASGYERYEAGTPHISGGIGLGAAVDYLQSLGMDQIRKCEEVQTERLIAGLRDIEGVQVYAHDDPSKRIGVVSFTVAGYHPHEVAQILDEEADIMVRSGHHCCMPLMNHLDLPDGTVRASLSLYSDKNDMDSLIASVQNIARGR